MAASDGSLDFAPAPGRGQYDRRVPRERRLAEQRERLVAATARALLANEAPTVAQVVGIAGTGRNTFYEFFDDVPHARRAAEARALKVVEEALRAAEARTRTPVERFRALVQAWFEVVVAAPAEAMLVLRSRDEAALSPAGEVFARALARGLDSLRVAGVVAGEREPLRAEAVAAAAEVFARSLARGLVSHAEPASAAIDRARVERVLVDVAVRLLR